MALENCFQVSTVCRAGMVQCYQPFSSIEKLHLATGKSLNKAKLSFSSSSSSSAHSLRGQSRYDSFICKAREALDGVPALTDSDWKDSVIGNSNPVMVEFWAPWCGPCRMIAPVVEELAKEYTGKIACYKVNTDECPNIATEYGIRSIPTVLFFKNGEKKESVIGAVPKTTLSATIDKYLE